MTSPFTSARRIAPLLASALPLSAFACACVSAVAERSETPPAPVSPPHTAPADTKLTPSGVATSDEDPFAPALLAFNRKRAGFERELRELRGKYFSAAQRREIRQEGLHKLREYREPAALLAMMNVFAHDPTDIRDAVLDHLSETPGDLAATILAWSAISDSRPGFRGACRARLASRLAATNAPLSPASGARDASPAVQNLSTPQTQPAASSNATSAFMFDPNGERVPLSVQSAIADGLGSPDNARATAAGQLAADLNVFDAIPMIINRMITKTPVKAADGASPAGGAAGGSTSGFGFGSGATAPGQSDAALAYILIGRQTTFVAGLTPVVGSNAIGFDPQIGVITDGTVLRVLDYYAYSYQVELHNALEGWTTAATGTSTAPLGWDQAAWGDWHANVLVPWLARASASVK